MRKITYGVCLLFLFSSVSTMADQVCGRLNVERVKDDKDHPAYTILSEEKSIDIMPVDTLIAGELVRSANSSVCLTGSHKHKLFLVKKVKLSP